MKNTGKIIQFLLETQSQFKILHWQTKKYARHIAFGEIYDKLDEHIDKFVEILMGKYGRFTLLNTNKTLKIDNISEVKLNLFIKNIQTKLIDMSDEFNEEDTDLANIRDEMLSEINKLSYLLTLE